MYCGICGTPLEADASFCPNCGGLVNEVAAGLLDDDADPDFYEADEEILSESKDGGSRAGDKKRRKWPFVLLGVLLALIIAFPAALFLLPRGSSGNADGCDSYTELITAYLGCAGARDESGLLDLFFPGSDTLYRSTTSDTSDYEVLSQEDLQSALYGHVVESVSLGKADFASMSDSSSANVASVVTRCSGLKDVSELFTVSADVIYRDGSASVLSFDIVQTENGYYLVKVS